MAESHYSFGVSDLAAERLRVVAEVFAPEMRAFLDASGLERRALALDLGCGPGHTTRLLAEQLLPERAVGIDSSTHFLEIARNGSNARGISFIEHDVTATPFPAEARGADAIFCHLLLTHLDAPQRTIEGWVEQLADAGAILVDEVESIEPGHPTLRRYLAIVDSMIRHYGGALYIGPLLDGLPAVRGVARRSSTLREHIVTSPVAAQMFRMNLETWRHAPFVKRSYREAEIADLATELEQLRDGSDATVNVWGMRQIVWERVR